ncbi:hypothetical protein FRB95_003084 [Tulasnella sp. JGI-2019a]|nr:hypothetical protein FRB95_003084 [Tulasnella sp. JGI-2019a]
MNVTTATTHSLDAFDDDYDNISLRDMKSSNGMGNVDLEVADTVPTTTYNSTARLTPPPIPPPPAWTPPPPSFSLLFSYLTRRDVYIYLVPAMLVSLVAGGIAPFMTKVIGQVFDALARYPLSTLPPDQAKHKLLHDVGIGALELLAMAAGTLLLSSLMASLWMWVGERNALRLRKAIYQSVTNREMEWFDLKMGQDDNNEKGSDGKGSDAGAGGSMAKFSRDTDDVRQATAINAGMLIQYTTTFLACLILALVQSWSLTLVILSSIPLLVLVQGFCQALATPFYNTERNKSASAGTRIERAVSSIPTVKAFNAQAYESAAVSNLIHAGRRAYMRCAAIWGVTAGITQFILFAMFVQGFWYGSKLVRQGKISPGNVMGVFWACLIASSNLQLCIPLLVVLTKGKAAMVSLDTLINQPLPSSKELRPVSVVSPNSRAFPPLHHQQQPKDQVMMKIIPQGKCRGAFALHNIRFAYPSRPTVPVLTVDDIYLPDGETTFIVGGSGSGKSTIAQLMLRMYEPESGTILFDDNDLAHLDRRYTRQHIASVSQTCILFDMTVHDNVAMGLKCAGGQRLATREEVEKACQTALMHEFVRDLPDGYDTRLGTGGASLSGGQRQRLAIARAMLRDPTVLILDEATSALDATSRVLVTEAIKTWRKNKTTIVITHDLSQIGAEDFVYVLKNGEIVERGYREELEKGSGVGEFKRMGEMQKFTQDGDELEIEEEVVLPAPEPEQKEEEEESSGMHLPAMIAKTLKRASKLPFASWASAATGTSEGGSGLNRALSGSNKHGSMTRSGSKKWMFDAVADLTKDVPSEEVRQAAEARASQHLSVGTGKTPLTKKLSINVHGRDGTVGTGKTKSRTSVQFKTSRHAAKGSKHQSLQFVPISPPPEKTTMWSNSAREKEGDLEDDDEFERYKVAMRATGDVAGVRRQGSQGVLRVRKSQNELNATVVETVTPRIKAPTLTGTVKMFFPTLPNKFIIALGVVLCLINGAMTPLFSVALAHLMEQVGSGANDVHMVAFWGKIVLFVALADGASAGAKFIVLENAAMSWVANLRTRAYDQVLKQDKTYFDDPEHNAGKIVQLIVKDGDDVRALIATVLSQGVVTTTMILVGFIWALVLGWQMTLVGFAIAPVFGIAMMGQSVLMSKFELRSKRAREKVEKRYFDTVSNVRAIRSMALEEVFGKQFDEAADAALEAGVHGAFVAGTGYGVANGLVYLAQAVIFYVGAVLLAKGTYSYLKMLTVINLVVFTMSIAAQLMTFIPKIAKSNQAAADLNTLLSLKDVAPCESQGAMRFPIRGDITFEGVDFAYPQRPDVPILKQLSFTIKDGECVAVVGSSGSGKSTITALLQRLYEPAAGQVTFGKRFQLQEADVLWLRSHIAVVSQHAALFDATIKDNILYGLDKDSVPFHQVQRAARDANLDNVISGLPDGYETLLGENASLISGGQAQRIQLARALVNGKANVLILDEFTSALDIDNQEALMATVMNLKEGRTTVIVTHKLPVMRKCDRILVLDQGTIVEEGHYDALMATKGHFWNLASAGEWAD